MLSPALMDTSGGPGRGEERTARKALPEELLKWAGEARQDVFPLEHSVEPDATRRVTGAVDDGSALVGVDDPEEPHAHPAVLPDLVGDVSRPIRG